MKKTTTINGIKNNEDTNAILLVVFLDHKFSYTRFKWAYRYTIIACTKGAYLSPCKAYRFDALME